MSHIRGWNKALSGHVYADPCAFIAAWCLRNEGVSSVLLGSSNPEQLIENLGAIQVSAGGAPPDLSTLLLLGQGQHPGFGVSAPFRPIPGVPKAAFGVIADTPSHTRVASAAVIYLTVQVAPGRVVTDSVMCHVHPPELFPVGFLSPVRASSSSAVLATSSCPTAKFHTES